MTLVALTHGYIRTHAMGGEVSLHRTLVAAGCPAVVLTRTDEPYVVDGVQVEQIATDDVLNVNADPAPIAEQLKRIGASVVLAQNELSLPAVRAARMLGIPSIVSIHTPPRFGRQLVEAVRLADATIYNTHTSAELWGEPGGLVIHPPFDNGTQIAPFDNGTQIAYTLLSNLRNKGVTVALDLAARMPDRHFIIVRSPAETTHGIPNFDERAAALPNVEVHPRVPPTLVADRYFSQTRILLVPSWYETYGMSAIEAAMFGIPSIHVDTPHVREGIGDAAILIPPLDTEAANSAIEAIEADYETHAGRARDRAEWLADRQTVELAAWREWLPKVRMLNERERAHRMRMSPRFR